MRNSLERRLAAITSAAFASIRIPGRRGDTTLLVRSTSLGDFAAFLPFLTTVYKQEGRENVDILFVSRTGDVVRDILGSTAHRALLIDPSNPITTRATIGIARSALHDRNYASVQYCTQETSAVTILKKLATIRAVVGWKPPIRGLIYLPNVSTPGDVIQDIDAIAMNHAVSPFLLNSITPSATRSDVFDLLHISADECDRTAHILREHGYESGRGYLIALFVHAQHTRKRWPLDRFTIVARKLLADDAAFLCFFGSSEDRAASDEVIAQLPRHRVANLAGRFTAREAIAALSRCELYVGNDASPAHFAALAGCRVVSLFCNWEAPGHWEPIASVASVSLRPAGTVRGPTGFGIDAIRVSHVLEAIDEVRAMVPAGGRHTIVTIDDRGRSVRRTLLLSPFAQTTVPDFAH